MTESTSLNGSKWHLLAGIVMALLGIYVWFNPVASLVGLALYLGICFIIVGAAYLTVSFSFQSGWYLLVGILDILVGIIMVANLGITAASLPVIFALWCLAVGVIQLTASFRLKKEGLSWSWSLAAGILGILFAFLILGNPLVGAMTITTLMGLYILLYGLIEIGEYFMIRRLEKL